MHPSFVVLVVVLAGFTALNVLLTRWDADTSYGADPRCDWGLD
jgi:hypothetical protein